MIRPLRDNIVVEPITAPGMVGLIHIPDVKKSTKNQTFNYGTIISAGKDVVLAKPGVKVLVSEYAGDPFTHEGKQVFIMRERDIVGVVSE